ncbi:MAG: zf-TFIIB domain-containing protein [Myxococcales bacterium]|nr:zf-TFIIB domain-containing protein [Myxococcales bacterium]
MRSVIGSAACPRCRVALCLRQAPDMEIRECPRCSGIWLDNRGCQSLIRGTLSELARETLLAVDAGAEQLSSAATGPAYRAPAPATNDPRLECPDCAAELVALMTTEDQHGVRVRLDVCSHHGTWFDRHEAWTLFQAAELRQLSYGVELQALAAERGFAEHERLWYGFTATAKPWRS